jgi:hypothetical protein
MTQSASNSHFSPKMSVDSESTHQNTSRMMFYITRSNSSGHNSIVHNSIVHWLEVFASKFANSSKFSQ